LEGRNKVDSRPWTAETEYLVITTEITSMALKKILGRPLRMVRTGEEGLHASPARVIKNKLLPLFKTPEPELKALDGNARGAQQITAGVGGCSFLAQRKPLPAHS